VLLAVMASCGPAKFRHTFTSEEIMTWIQEKYRKNDETMIGKNHLRSLKGNQPPQACGGVELVSQVFHFNIGAKINGSRFMVLDAGLLAGILKLPVADTTFILSLKESIVECYGVSAKYRNAKHRRGVRAALYKWAQEHNACYSPTDRSRSIWYDDESTDLNIALWFKEETKAGDFCCFLSTWHQKNPIFVKSGDVTVEEKIETMLVEKDELSAVRLSHYAAGDSESPVQSLDEFDACKSSTCSVVSLDAPLVQFQSFEDRDTLRGYRPYVCHVKPKAKFEALKNKEYNTIAASWHFHQMFDGLNTEDLKTGEHDLPLLAVRPLKTEIKEEMVGEPARKRTRVGVELEFRDPEYGNNITLKPGSTKISDTKWKTFVHVKDEKIFCECLEWKNNHTRKKWMQADQFDQITKDRD
jgi:hypothetical protein